jgi:hypothetical protein
MDHEYAGICGITKEELETQMSADVDALAVKMNLTRTQTLDALREFYDGYHFAAQSPDIFNPYSLLYVDKTEYVYRMTHSGGKHFFLSRPRRFGKSLLVSTFKSYFLGKKELFKGLAIEKLEKDWTEYPVLHFSMAGGKHMEKDQLERYLGNRLAEQEKVWGIKTPAVDANDRLIALIQTAYEKTGKQVVVLIDEYDAPLLDVVHEDAHLKDLRNVMRNFYSPLKDCEPMLRFVFCWCIKLRLVCLATSNFRRHYLKFLKHFYQIGRCA